MTTPNDVVRGMFAHHLWATEALIDHLSDLPPERLDAAVPGTYGSMLQTLTHLIEADERYLVRLRESRPAPYPNRGAVPLDELRQELREHAKRWGVALDELEAGELSADVIGKEDYPDTRSAETMLLIQAIHHGDDHRTQICSTLGALGEDVPELDGWEYWRVGRDRP